MSENDDRWRRRIDALGPTPFDRSVDELLGEMQHEATAPGRVAAAVWQHPEKMALGRRLIVGLGPNAVQGLLYSEVPDDPAARAWRLRQVVEAELGLRAQLVERLLQALDDKAWIEEPPPPVPVEPAPPKLRVCDEAYLQLRALLHPEEDQVGFGVDRDAFLNMPAQYRDETILRARQKHRWNLRPPTPDELGL